MRIDLYIIGEPHIMSERWELFTKLIENNTSHLVDSNFDMEGPHDSIIEVEDDNLRIWMEEDHWLQSAQADYTLSLSHPDMLEQLQNALKTIDNHLAWKDFGAPKNNWQLQ